MFIEKYGKQNKLIRTARAIKHKMFKTDYKPIAIGYGLAKQLRSEGFLK